MVVAVLCSAPSLHCGRQDHVRHVTSCFMIFTCLSCWSDKRPGTATRDGPRSATPASSRLTVVRGHKSATFCRCIFSSAFLVPVFGMTFSSSSQTRFRNPHRCHFASLLCARFRSVPLSAVSKITRCPAWQMSHTLARPFSQWPHASSSRASVHPRHQRSAVLPSSVTRSQAADITQMQLGRCASPGLPLLFSFRQMWLGMC